MPRQGSAQRSLLMFVQALQGRTLIVELRSDLAVRGCIESIDDEMKCVGLLLAPRAALRTPTRTHAQTRAHLTLAVRVLVLDAA
jgi:hypothetical protein